MRYYLSTHLDRRSCFTPEELNQLDDLVQRAINALAITAVEDRNETVARILSLHILGGRSPEEILDIAIRLHQQSFAPGGRRSTVPPPKRIRTERQRRNLKPR